MAFSPARRGLSHCLRSSSFLTAAPASFTPLCSFLPTFRSISPRSYPLLLHIAETLFTLTHQPPALRSQLIPQSLATIFAGFHSAPLRHTFTAALFSPPAARKFCSPVAPLRLRSASAAPFTMALHCSAAVTQSWSKRRNAALSFTCIVQPPPHQKKVSYGGFLWCCPSPCTNVRVLLSSPVVGARSRLRSFLPLASLTARYAATLRCRLLPGTAHASFCRRRFYRFCQRTANSLQSICIRPSKFLKEETSFDYDSNLGLASIWQS